MEKHDIEKHDIRIALIGTLKAAFLQMVYSLESKDLMPEEAARLWVAENPTERLFPTPSTIDGLRFVGQRRAVLVLLHALVPILQNEPHEFLFAQIMAARDFTQNEKYRALALTQIQSGDTPEGFNPETFSLVLKVDRPIKLGGPAGEPIKFITDVEARVLHDQEGALAAISEARASGVNIDHNLFDGLWIFADLSDITNRNSALKLSEAEHRAEEIRRRKRGDRTPNKANTRVYIVTKALTWYMQTVPQAIPIVNEFKRTQSRRTQSRRARVAPVVAPPTQSGINIDDPSAPDISLPEEVIRRNEQIDDFAVATINKMLANLRQQMTIGGVMKKVNVRRRLNVAAGVSVNRGKKNQDTFNLTSTRLLIPAPRQKNKGKIFGVVDGRILFGESRPVRVAIDISNSKLVIWFEAIEKNSRTSSNKELQLFIRDKVMQAVFDGFVAEFFAGEMVRSTGTGISSDNFQALSLQEKTERLAELFGDAEEAPSVDQRTIFGRVFVPGTEIGFPSEIIHTLPLLREDSLNEIGGDLPPIRRERELIAEQALNLDDTEARLEIFEENLREFNEIVQGSSSTIQRIREEQLDVEPREIELAEEGFAVARPSREQRELLQVDVRIPAPPDNSNTTMLQ